MSERTYIIEDKSRQAKDSSVIEKRFIATNRADLSAETWQAAIDFAERKIDQLKVLVRIFAEYRDTDHPFPGQSQNMTEHGRVKGKRAA